MRSGQDDASSSASRTQLDVPARLVRGAYPDHDQSIRSACWLIDHICEHLDIPDLGQTEMLDVGCGVKFTEAILNSSLPVKRYVGCDVDGDLISYLQGHVDDPRLEYFHLPARNARYNPEGTPLGEFRELPIASRTFDLIVLLSVFTHLDPSDYRSMLVLLRPYAASDTVLFFSLYIDELTEGGHGLVDGMLKAMAGTDAHTAAPVERVDGTTGARPIEPFRDLDPSRPLLWALYSQEYARELIEGTGWQVATLSPPDRYIQHHFVCTPC